MKMLHLQISIDIVFMYFWVWQKKSHNFFEKSESWSHWMLVCQPTVVFQCDPPGWARRWLKCSQVAGNYMETVWNCCQLQMYQTKQGPLSFPSWTKLVNGPTWGCKPCVRPYFFYNNYWTPEIYWKISGSGTEPCVKHSRTLPPTLAGHPIASQSPHSNEKPLISPCHEWPKRHPT